MRSRTELSQYAGSVVNPIIVIISFTAYRWTDVRHTHCPDKRAIHFRWFGLELILPTD